MTAVLLWLPPAARACATCFGKSDAPLAHGMNMGIATMLGFVGLMWLGFGALIVHFVRRAARPQRSPEAARSAEAPTIFPNS